MITSQGLEKLGFKLDDDFILQDNSDGQGTFISAWTSAQPQPSVSEIEAAHAEWKSEWGAQEYARNRKEEYPPLNDLIVALWERVVEERIAAVTELEAQRQAVKTKYPKA